MRKRSAACLALLVFLAFWLLPAGLFYEPQRIQGKCQVQVTGCVDRQIPKDEKSQIYLRTCQVRNEEIQFQTEYLLVYMTDSTEYPVGTDLSLSGTIYPIENPTNPGQFDSRLYYEGKEIAYTVYADSVSICGGQPAPIRSWLMGLKKRVGRVYEETLRERDSSLLRAMVLGEKEGLDPETKEFYQRNGISHLLAISGLHVSLIGMGFYRLLKKLTGSCVLAGIPSMLFLCAYGWMTGASVSTIRAVVMCSLSILADLIGRTYDMLTAIGVSALLLLLSNPVNARQSGFLLSFGAVLAIALIQPVWTLYKRQMKGSGQSVSVSLSVLAVTFPLLLCFFFEYPLYSVLLNLAAIPLMSVLMIAGIACGAVGLCLPPAAKLPGAICHLILSLYEWMGEKCLSLPGSVLYIGTPPAWKVMLYYSVLTIVLIFFYREKRRAKYWRKKEPFRPSRRVAAGGVSALTVCALLLCLRIHTGLEVTMLDVGQGDCLFFRSPAGTTFLMDGGSLNVKNVGKYRILPFLASKGVGELDYVLISHLDQDHISGIQELLEDSRSDGGIRIGHVALAAPAKEDEAFEELEAILTEEEIPVILMGTGDSLAEENFSLTCLSPGREESLTDRNEQSLVLMAEYGEFQMLLTGDIGEETERELVSSGCLRQVEVLKTAHHGSRHSSAETFLSRIRPSVSLISCSATNRYGHPGEETLERLTEVGSRIYITKDSGAVRVWTDGHEVRVREYKDASQ
ncbi:MAG: DNA internalization-related competence protein ComEC/Rec2 [Clostridiales bacterium]|nr:DNA internalization-related competence protein ComEC/Rec2 [Clostridiales bacterium]